MKLKERIDKVLSNDEISEYEAVQSQSKNTKSIWILVAKIVSLALLPMMLLADENLYTVSGSVSFSKNGDIYLEFITPEGSTQKAPDGMQLSVKDSDKKPGKVLFRFDNVPAGRYAIQAFQDVNGNGKLDFGVTGPKEPWGFYKNVRPLLRGPEFEEMAFDVNNDIVIKMEVK